eukprot:scpid7815/ scgid7731/ 
MLALGTGRSVIMVYVLLSAVSPMLLGVSSLSPLHMTGVQVQASCPYVPHMVGQLATRVPMCNPCLAGGRLSGLMYPAMDGNVLLGSAFSAPLLLLGSILTGDRQCMYSSIQSTSFQLKMNNVTPLGSQL